METDLNVVRVKIPQFTDYKVVVLDGSGVEFQIIFKDGEYTVQKLENQVAN